MNKYGIGYFLFFIALTLITHFVFKANGWLGYLILLLYLPLVFGLIYFIKAFIFLIKSDFIKTKLSLLIFLNYLIVSLKLDYTYYNLIFCLLVILLNFMFLFSFRSLISSKLGTILMLSLSLIILLAATPDTLIFKFINRKNDQIAWNNNINWKCFKGEADKDNKVFGASIYSFSVWRINKVMNYPQAISIAKMDMVKSWNAKKHETDYLLNHEQGHFNLTEIYRRLAMDSIKSLKMFKNHDVKPIIFHFKIKLKKIHDIYDKETDHSLIRESQLKWDNMIANKLDSLDS